MTSSAKSGLSSKAKPVISCYIHSDICSAYVEADDGVVIKIVLLKNSPKLNAAAVEKSRDPEEFPLPTLIESFERYFGGAVEEFDFKCDLSGLTELEQRILRVVNQIPYGQTMTYSEVAEKVGNVNLRRVVGRAVGKNRCPIVIPCHRVVGKGGRMTGFSADGGVGLKQELLELESGRHRVM